MSDSNVDGGFENGYFTFRDGYLYCEEVNVDALRKSLAASIFPSSPFYLYSKKQIQDNVESYKKALQEFNIDYSLNYAAKANSNLSVLKIMKDLGCSLTTASGMELKLALEVGFEASMIVMNGTGKQLWELEMAITAGALVNIDSDFDAENIIEVARKLGKDAKVLIRVNPDVDPRVHHYVNTGKEGTKFGVSLEDISTVLGLLEIEPLVHLVGIHVHLGSTIDDTSVFRKSTELVLTLFSNIESKGFKSLKYLNIGGGLGIPYGKNMLRTHCYRNDSKASHQRLDKLFEELEASGITTEMFQSCKTHLSQYKSEKTSKQEFLSAMMRILPTSCPVRNPLSHFVKTKDRIQSSVPSPAETIKEIKDVIGDKPIKLMLEPGRSLIGNSTILVTNILGTKHSGNKRYVVCDGAMTELLRPCLYEAYHHAELIEPSTRAGEGKHLFDIVGPVCESGDFLGKDRLLSVPHRGCGLAVFDTGAYCSSMGSNYNFRLKPAEILVDGSSWKLIRQPDKYEDCMKPFYDLDNGVP
ncbi:hypothetical protein ScPMuIL_013933 [Solemya velum]